jgi:hypothetical protein
MNDVVEEIKENIEDVKYIIERMKEEVDKKYCFEFENKIKELFLNLEKISCKKIDLNFELDFDSFVDCFV